VQRWKPPAATCSTSTSGLPTSPATGASARNLRRGGQNRRRGGGMELATPPTASVGQPDEAGPSAPHRRPDRRAPRGDGPPAGPLGRGELRIASLSLRSSRARLTVAAVTMLLLWRRGRRRGRPRHVAPIHHRTSHVATP
jgi:hypothetical protein